ncbi:MAG: hypothetical protein GWN67_01140 [Phycisphaerae bacterium]|nr:hypothetical protein [Phycisphaerae bacterium]NIP51544.1 hypothetical protein [Phycisphaerae bacterium]NIS49721.1 hypothetical protein [Phycisphaerae bacterium]NIU07453.1 hypothetical protein [Phycisphaerae bacterium]NIU55040.1 hypothetical protein [Phycisphaerae bacterium]
MFSKKIIPISIVGIVLLACMGQASGGTFVLRSSTSIGHCIGRPVTPVVYHRPFYKKHVFHHIHYRTFLKRRPRHHHVVVRRPYTRQIAINLVPKVTVTRPEIVVEPTTVTVWITNSNGSQTSVNLRRSGPGFLGPRNEWYPSMPTNEQLRIVYGF